MTATLCIIFSLSGASALIFEVLWFNLLGLSLGNSIWATTMVLSSFMGGLALGNGLTVKYGHKIRSPIRFYAYIEIIIGLSGIALVLIMPNLTQTLVPILQNFTDQVLILNGVRASVAFFLMLIPTTLMGATLPILVKGLYAERPNFGHVLGILYGWNTFGAVLGVITNELALIPLLGIRGAGFVAFSLNILAAFMAFTLIKTGDEDYSAETNQVPASTISLSSYKKLAAGFLSGFVLLALEVIWFRFFLLFFHANGWTFASMLAVVLAGISLGGLLASKWFRMSERADIFLVSAAVVNGLLVLGLYAAFPDVLETFGATGRWRVAVILMSVFLMFPVSFVSGIIFTILGKALHSDMRAEMKVTGLLTLANTTGGVVGAGVAGLILIPTIGIEASFFVLALVYVLIGCIVFERETLTAPMRWSRLQYLIVPLFFIAMVRFPFGSMEQVFLDYPIKKFNERRVAYREGLTETIQYLQKDLLQKPYSYTMVTNNHTMTGTSVKSKRYMKMFVYLPVALHPDPKNALLISYGLGSTAKALTDEKNFKRIDIVDISRDVVEMSEIVFPDKEKNPIYDPRVNVHIEDGRFFLLVTDQKYDLITAEPPPPHLSGVVNLYTKEYFQLTHERLEEGGFVTYWLPVYQMKESETKAIVKGFCKVFENCSLWTAAAYEWMLVGTKGEMKKVSEDVFRKQWNDPVVGPEMHSLGFESPEQMGSLFIADGKRLSDWIADSQPLVDNYPRRLSYGDHARSKHIKIYRDFMDVDESRSNFIESGWIESVWPNDLLNQSVKHFTTREWINEILAAPPYRQLPRIFTLHKSIVDPMLKNYILLALGSDQYAQDIIARTVEEEGGLDIKNMGGIHHMMANAAQQGEYKLAEEYLNVITDRLSHDDKRKELYLFYRMYFNFLVGDKERAEDVKMEYVNLKNKNPKFNVERLEQYWHWLENNVGT